MREDRGDVEAAARGETPRLVRDDDLRGDLHTHTDLTDGVATLEDTVAAAQRRGYAYYAITDHAPNHGVGTAQRGWLTPDDVINTWPLDRLRAFLAEGRGGTP